MVVPSSAEPCSIARVALMCKMKRLTILLLVSAGLWALSSLLDVALEWHYQSLFHRRFPNGEVEQFLGSLYEHLKWLR